MLYFGKRAEPIQLASIPFNSPEDEQLQDLDPQFARTNPSSQAEENTAPARLAPGLSTNKKSNSVH